MVEASPSPTSFFRAPSSRGDLGTAQGRVRGDQLAGRSNDGADVGDGAPKANITATQVDERIGRTSGALPYPVLITQIRRSPRSCGAGPTGRTAERPNGGLYQTKNCPVGAAANDCTVHIDQ
jgi:hypothetical protein